MTSNKQEKLVELFSNHFHSNFNFGPLQSKIMGYLIIFGKKDGVTFEDILNYTQASKSSVSTSLNCLLERNNISFYLKPNDRKKYFTPNKLSSLLERTIHIIQSELSILTDLIEYYEECNSIEQDIKQINNIRIYKLHLEGIENSVRKTLKKLE